MPGMELLPAAQRTDDVEGIGRAEGRIQGTNLLGIYEELDVGPDAILLINDTKAQARIVAL